MHSEFINLRINLAEFGGIKLNQLIRQLINELNLIEDIQSNQ